MFIDDAMLREPNLWIPGKKPLGRVELNPEHPLSNHAVHCFLDMRHNIASNTNVFHSGDLPKEVRPDGSLWTLYTRGDYTYWNAQTYRFSAGEATVFIELENATTDNLDAMLWLMGPSSGATFRNFNGLVYDDAFSTIRDISGITPARTATDPSVYCVSSKAGTNNVAVIEGAPLGELAITTSVTRTAFGLPTNMSIGVDASVPTYGYYGWIKHLYVFNKALSLSEATALNRDPYQFLIPA